MYEDENEVYLSSINYIYLYEVYFERITTFIFFKIGDIDIAKDIAQESFLKLWEKKGEVLLKTANALLFTIAYNLVLNYFKHRNIELNYSAQVEYENKKSIETPVFLLEMKEFEEKLNHAINILPQKSRETFLKSRIEGKSYKEIADELDIGIKAVEKRMQKALQQMRLHISFKL